MTVLLALLIGSAWAQPTDPTQFHNRVQTLMAEKKVTAGAVAVVRPNRIDYVAPFGEIQSGKPTDSKSIFRIASVSKTFTAIGLLKMVDRGQVDLDRPIYQYLPWFELKGSSDRWKRITVRHLLNHTSGISREMGCEFTTDRGEWVPLFDLSACLKDREVVFEPGTRLKYSNFGIILLGGLIAELNPQLGRTMEERFQNYMRTEVLNPLGMRDTWYTLDQNRLSRLAEPLGNLDPETGRRERLMAARSTYISAPAWGVASTIDDMARYMEFIIKIIEGKENGLISKNLADQILARPVQDSLGNTGFYQGLGLNIRASKTSILIGHGGHFPGYTTQFYYDQIRRLGLVVLTNSIERSAASGIQTAVLESFPKTEGVGTDVLEGAEQLTSDGSEQEPDYVLAYQKANWLADLDRFSGRYKGWPEIVSVTHENGKLMMESGGQKWILIPDCEEAMVFRLNNTGKPNYVGFMGEEVRFRRLENDPTGDILFGGAYSYKKIK